MDLLEDNTAVHASVSVETYLHPALVFHHCAAGRHELHHRLVTTLAEVLGGAREVMVLILHRVRVDGLHCVVHLSRVERVEEEHKKGSNEYFPQNK